MSERSCRFCRAPLHALFADLGLSPLCQSQLEPEELDKGEEYFPLRVFVCERCLLVQMPAYVGPERIFSEYAYFSSFADTLLRQSEAYADMAVRRFGLDEGSRVLEVASNDGYLLQYFARRGLAVLGIEPAGNVAKAAEAKGIPTLTRFFGEETARVLAGDGLRADLLIGNNVLPHVPDLHDFAEGLKILLKETGILSLEFQHLMRMMAGNQFDTIYQEHFSYLSFALVEKLLSEHGLELFDVEEIPNHGGSLRVFARHAGPGLPVGPRVAEMRAREDEEGMGRLHHYLAFGERAKEAKRNLLEFLIAAKREGKTIAGYGAAGKTNTLLNYCGIRGDFIDYTVDRNPHKQGRYLPGSRIPIVAPSRIRETRPDFLFVGPWNLAAEIIEQTAFIREWGGRWIIPIPEVRIRD